MNIAVRTTLRMAFRIAVATLAVAAIAALCVLIAAQFWPEASNARIQWGEHSTHLNGVFSDGIFTGLLVWGLMTIAILLGVLITLFALTVTAVALGATGLALALPLIIIVAIVWFIARRSQRTSGGGTLSPGA
jgi:hypothetical protein